jgi:hypothetical protein
LKKKVIKKNASDEERKREGEKLKRDYDEKLREFASPYGDVVSLFQLYQKFQYKDRERKRGLFSDEGDGETSQAGGADNAGPNPLKKWCQENYLQYQMFQRVQAKRRQLADRWRRVVRTTALETVGAREGRSRHESILLAVARSCFVNYVKRKPSTGFQKKPIYETMANITSVTAPLDDNSREFTSFVNLLGKRDSASINDGICLSIKSIFNNTKLGSLNVLTKPVLEELRKVDKYKAIMDKKPKANANANGPARGFSFTRKRDKRDKRGDRTRNRNRDAKRERPAFWKRFSRGGRANSSRKGRALTKRATKSSARRRPLPRRTKTSKTRRSMSRRSTKHKTQKIKS